MYVDSHAHLEMTQFDADREEVIARAKQVGVTGILTMGCDLPSSRAAIEIASRHDGVYAAVGFHPHDAASFDEAAGQELAKLSAHPKVVAIGEIGLDFYRNRSPQAVQVQVLRTQLGLAKSLALPVIVHVREAYEAAGTILEEWTTGLPEGNSERGIIHCFSGDIAFAQQCVDLGFLISLAGPLTYPNATGLVRVAETVPLAKLLIETDCPYLAPQRYRGKRNEPAYVVEVARKLAEVRALPVESVAKQTTENLARLLRMGAF